MVHSLPENGSADQITWATRNSVTNKEVIFQLPEKMCSSAVNERTEQVKWIESSRNTVNQS